MRARHHRTGCSVVTISRSGQLLGVASYMGGPSYIYGIHSSSCPGVTSWVVGGTEELEGGGGGGGDTDRSHTIQVVLATHRSQSEDAQRHGRAQRHGNGADVLDNVGLKKE